MRAALVGVVAAAVLAGSSIGAAQAQPDFQQPSYDHLLSLDPAQRELALRKMPVHERIALKRTHAQRWLHENRASLSASQTALVQEAIDLLAPERYRDRDPEVMKQEAEIGQRLWCSLGEDRAAAAFTFGDAPPRTERTWSSLVHSWTEWLVECVIG